LRSIRPTRATTTRRSRRPGFLAASFARARARSWFPRPAREPHRPHRPRRRRAERARSLRRARASLPRQPAAAGDELDDVGKAIEEARSLAAAGAAALVEWTPLELGRNLDGLAAVSEATGLQVVAATALHREAHYGAHSPLRALDPDALADRFVADLARCGVVKVGASYHRLTPFEEGVFEAAAAAHARTGAPVCVHTELGTMGLWIVERLGGLGVHPHAVVLAHLDRNPDAGQHAETSLSVPWRRLPARPWGQGGG
jgi:predicted metal-dependent phosphotriesterase family hydrolase